MRFDLDRAMYSHCEHAPDVLSASMTALLDDRIARIVGAPVRRTRLVTYLQGAVTLLDEGAEFRAHVWFDLPEGHPGFVGADRGLAWLLRPIDRDGLRGPTWGGLGWLGRPLSRFMDLPEGDWVAEMIREQGYLHVPGAEWEEPLDASDGAALLASLLGPHLADMTNHVILEERLGLRPPSSGH